MLTLPTAQPTAEITNPIVIEVAEHEQLSTMVTCLILFGWYPIRNLVRRPDILTLFCGPLQPSHENVGRL